MTRLPLAIVLSVSLFLTGCASQTTTPDQYSGFLSDYSQLKPAQSASGVPVMRWVAADFKPQNYHSIYVEKPVFYPAPKPNDQVSQQTLDEIAVYLQQAIQREMSSSMTIAHHPDANSLILRTAISAVELTPEGLKVYEVIPIALVAAAASTAAGTRDLETDVYVEVEVLDGASRKPVTRVVRKGHGQQLENSSTQLSLKDIKPVLDEWAKDVRNFKP
ncbi:DUF3313 domain-containing protein [Ectopseudomonas mendocina]|uniref:DUF3313 domain-containing protein n=1 Tax=Ectopseudomonas mendocina TaxID=300 RepID=A0ABZ2RK61_ECTME